MKKYGLVFSLAARNQVVYLPAFVARNVFFIIIVFIFTSLWRVIYGGEHTIAGLTMQQVIWYFTLTELVELSKSMVFPQIQSEVKDGTIAYTLIRPMSYILYFFYRSMGQNMVRLGIMIIEAFVLACLFAGYLPGYLQTLSYGIILIIAAVAITALWQICIGLLAFWFEEVSPFYMIIQKLIFIIGGMFFPIDFFPGWMQGIAKASPFAFSAYWPAISIVNPGVQNVGTCIAGQAFYLVVLAAAAAGLFRAAVRKVHVQGG